MIGAAPHQRTTERTTRRNGARPKTLATPAGEVNLQIPKLREGSFFPSLLTPRRRVDKALYAVICQAWIDGVSTRKVDQLVRALGNDTGISRSTVSRICAEIDETVQEFLHRRLDHTLSGQLRHSASVELAVGARSVENVAPGTVISIPDEAAEEFVLARIGDKRALWFFADYRGSRLESAELDVTVRVDRDE
ncbi:hypothetical protein GCM10009776_27910 [Microbacterium deminutum]|uniref:Mutator family transposase n=1 Tax=Microbacterium deminutum TaxID=344164 RepID=A0ABP5CHB5_9MICO